ncbi:protoporphyrinogen oxidase [Corynebacterium epidermidicanis]|uniref:Coproporphyrinogen III oxidase n=1 Tax=Corynebacterium epidermidicanis TaxID=1050174 RepID=A0A0G3GS62_9CORY|nr:protoporphyrinogen oxidase [Corynebacterium epidermidicanis]AKK04041.1 protoporphyrinogen oxidase [Corynebacterium epidermidicanis]
MKFAIIGAGLAGLTAAYELRQLAPDAEIDVFEAEERIGGKLFTVPFESGRTDMGAEAFINFRADARAFFEKLGLADSLVYPSGLRSLIYSGGQLHQMPASGAMGIPATSAALEGLISPETAARIDDEANQPGIDWDPASDLSVGALVRERYGDDVVDHVVSSLLGGVYSCSADDLGIRATIPALAAVFDQMVADGEKVTLSAAVAKMDKQRAAARASSDEAPKPVFAAFRGGYAELYEELAEQSGARIHLDSFISAIEKKGEKFQLKGGEGEFDRVLVTTPAPTAAAQLRLVAPEASKALKQVKLASSAVVGMKFDSAEGLPENSGILIATDEPGVHAKAFTLSSKKWPHLAERGGALVRASFGRFGDDALVRAEEDDLVDYALDDLQKITGFDGRAAGLAEIFVQRWFGGLPRYDATHLATVATVRSALTAVDGIDVAGAWADGVGVPAVIAGARAAAGRIAK